MEDFWARVLASLSFRRELQHGAYFGEGWGRPHHGDEGGLLVEILAEPNDNDVDELRVADGIAEFAKLVTDGLDALAEEVDRGIALGHVTKLGVQSVFPSVTIALKKLAKRAPDVGGGGAVVIKHVEDLSGDAGVEPLNNREIVFHPLRIMGLRKTVGGNVRPEVAASQV
jgi:hypothetical protein